MKITINGESRECPADITLQALLGTLGITSAAGIAVAVNEQVVPRSVFSTKDLRDGDVVEVIRAVAGG